MVALILYILLTVLLGMVFKAWKQLGIHILPGILHNYLVCMGMALVFHGEIPSVGQVVQKPWIPLAVLLGLLFISGFYVFALALNRSGVGTVTAVQKMSMLLNVLFAILFLGNTPGIVETVGIIVGTAALPFLAYVPDGKTPGLGTNSGLKLPALWLLLTFLLSGATEIGLTMVELHYADSSADPLFIGTVFFLAFTLGWSILMMNSALRRHFFSVRHMLAGLALGIPNYLSIHFLMKSLGSEIPTYLVLPMANVGTILVAVVVGYYTLKERIFGRQAIGLLLAMLALFLMTLPKMP